MELQDRVALVTGAGHRVGRAIAVALAGRGMRIAVHFHAAAGGARETLREVEKAGGSGAMFSADLTEPDAPQELVEKVAKEFAALDVLVNSAAVMLRTPFESVTPSEWDGIMALNLRAPFFLARAAAAHLRRARGVIINIADLAAFETWPAYVPHGLSKSGVVAMTRALANLLAPDVRVAGIAPGAVLLPEGWTEADADRLRASTPLRSLGSPTDVTRTLLFLLDSDFITGETVVVDGGRNIRR